MKIFTFFKIVNNSYLDTNLSKSTRNSLNKQSMTCPFPGWVADLKLSKELRSLFKRKVRGAQV